MRQGWEYKKFANYNWRIKETSENECNTIRQSMKVLSPKEELSKLLEESKEK